MHYRLTNLYNILSIFVLGTALFIMQPQEQEVVAVWQNNIISQATHSFEQLWGDKPLFSEAVFVYEGITGFYEESSRSLYVLLRNEELDSDIAVVFGQVYNNFAMMFGAGPQARVAGVSTPDVEPAVEIDLSTFMTQEPIYDLAPVHAQQTETVAAAEWSAPSATPVNLNNPWFTVVDGFTGQTYCMAVYNGEVNKYLGECKYDYY